MPVENVEGVQALKKTDDKESVIRNLKRALRRAAKEAYQNEVVDTGMKFSVIGGDNPYRTVEDWLEDRMDDWKGKRR